MATDKAKALEIAKRVEGYIQNGVEDADKKVIIEETAVNFDNHFNIFY